MGSYSLENFLAALPKPAMVLDSKHHQIVALNHLMATLVGIPRELAINFPAQQLLSWALPETIEKIFAMITAHGGSYECQGDLINQQRQLQTMEFFVSRLEGKKQELLVIINQRERSIPTPLPSLSNSPQMEKINSLLHIMATSDSSVLLTGETGTGKDKTAEIIHQNSKRAAAPFIKVNCGALPPGLLESELFGHVRGAFTGADRDKAGVFKLADGGTLFLTEIGDMPLPLQVKLLSVLDDHTFVPVGGEKKTAVDVRIITATHRSLQEQINSGSFREDLFYRLHVLHLHIPPLRERREDLHELMKRFCAESCQKLNKSIEGINREATKQLLNYQYPGNIRELKNIIEYAVHLCGEKKLRAEDLPPYMHNQAAPTQPPPIPRAESWREIERTLIIDTLKATCGNRTKAAASLGWGRMKLWRKMKEFELL